MLRYSQRWKLVEERISEVSKKDENKEAKDRRMSNQAILK